MSQVEDCVYSNKSQVEDNIYNKSQLEDGVYNE